MRAARLVVDTGLHALRWTRQQSIDFLLQTGLSETDATIETDRYIAWPGQALTYMIGCREIEKLRRDITEGRPGVPLSLRLHVVDASTCKPIKGAAVDIWHADALGVYSGFGSGSGNRTFMRGIQKTDATGLARFRSVWPGWYQGRTVHIHVKVHVGGNVVHTGQLYFPDSLTDAVFRRKPYSRRGKRTTRNANDFVFAQGGRRSLLSVRKSGSAYVASITMGVHRS